MKHLKPKELSYWSSYVKTLPDDKKPADAVVTAGYAGTPEITDELLALYLAGKKTAGSSVLEDYISSGDRPPEVGNFWIFLNSKNQPSCILRTDKVVTHAFKNVPSDVAIAEGEGDLSLDYWRKVHSEIWLPLINKWGVTDLENATVVTEFYTNVYK
jgi:5-formyltetrahydrofolate cyclo-ligase